MLVGILMVCLGIVFLLDNLGYLKGGVGNFIIPVFLVVLGASMILKRIGSRDS
jgi:hypothetical protein